MKAAVLTVSDKASRGEREDESGAALKEILLLHGYELCCYKIVPDEIDVIAKALCDMCAAGANIVLTTGGTGFAVRDVTPEATMQVAQRTAPGIAQALRAYSMTITPRAMLSRGVSVLRDKSLIVNMPGSPRAVREQAEYLLPNIAHGLDILLGNDGECARK